MRIHNHAVIDGRWQVERPLTTDGQHYLLTDRQAPEGSAHGVLSLLPEGMDAAAAEQQRSILLDTTHPGIMLPEAVLMVDDQAALLTESVAGRPLDETSAESLADLLRLIARSVELVHGLHLQGRCHGHLQAGLIWLKNSTTPRLCGLLPESNLTELTMANKQDDLHALASILLDQLIDPAAAVSEACRQACRDYPDAMALCRLHSAPRPQMAVPESLARLLHDILDPGSDDEASKVSSIGMIEFRDRLDDLALSVSRSTPRSKPDWALQSVLSTQQVESTTAPEALSDVPEKRRAQQWILPALLVCAALALLLVGNSLLRSTPDAELEMSPSVVDAAPAEIETEAIVAEVPEVPDEAALQALFEARERAQQTLDSLISDRQILDERAVTDWADEPYALLLALKSEGDQLFVQQQFDDAQNRYADALAISQSLVERWPQERDSANQRGMAALDEGDSATALASFTLAAGIDSDDAKAQKGLLRAAVLDEVLLLSRQARQALRDEDLSAAIDLYRQVKTLDSDTPDIEQNIASIQAQLDDQSYRDAVSSGLSALEQGRFEASRASFNQANRIRPGTTVVRDGLQDIERRLRDQRVVDHRQRAEQLIANEQWQDAVRHFDEVLKRDPDAAFAQRGRVQAAERQALDESLTDMLANPSRWWSPRGRELMQAALNQATAIAPAGPRLDSQITRLKAELTRSNRAVEVALESDNQCQVDVYRVSRLGQFSETSLKLKPGSYTVVGTRPGYRDVRKVVQVQAGQPPDPVRVFCDEEV